MKYSTDKMVQFKQWIKSIFSKHNFWKFHSDNEYNFQFKVSFPIIGGYKETNIINMTVPANTEIEAEKKLQLFVKEKIKVTVIKVKKL